MAFPATYTGDSDADDEFERSVMTSPGIATDDDGSVSDSDAHSNEHTPTTYSHADGDALSPKTIISEWTADECSGFVKSLGLGQYCANFLENEIVGEALIALRHEELKEMGVSSVGHRLTILKGVYDIKIKQDIPIEQDHYVPLSADESLNNKKATQEDISRIIRSIKLRDERILAYEQELKRMQEEYRKLREELLPVFRMAKERSQPLPSPIAPQSPDIYNSHDGLHSPVQNATSQQSVSNASLARKPSKQGPKAFWINNATPKNASPTYMQQSVNEGKTPRDPSLDPSAAAVAASSHLTASMTERSPNPATLPSPTSPQYYHNSASARGGYSAQDSASIIAPSTYSNFSSYGGQDLLGYAGGATLNPETASTYRSGAPTPTPGRSRGGSTRGDPDDSSKGEAPSVEIFKSFRVSMEDPCYKVLPAALKKYSINADWRQYALYIVYGDQERCLGLEEKPLILFKQLDKEGKKPMFMLRKHAAPEQGHSGLNSAGYQSRENITSGGQGIPMSLPQLPGGVL